MSAPVRIGLVAVSDRASQGVYVDQGLPALHAWLSSALVTPWQPCERLIADERTLISTTLTELVDHAGCSLVLTTGGTGPAPRDVTPEATLDVSPRVLAGFGERMRAISHAYAPTAILSRQVAVTYKQALIINLPGRPKAISENLQAIFDTVPYCIKLLGGPHLDTNPNVIVAFRPGTNKT